MLNNNNNSKFDNAVQAAEAFFASYWKVLNQNADQGFLHFAKVFYQYPFYHAQVKMNNSNVINTKKATFGLFDKTVEIDPADMYNAKQIKDQIKNMFKF